MSQNTLVYYFAFPHYRKSILLHLRTYLGNQVEFVSGSTARSGIARLSDIDIDGLKTVRTRQFGPFTWDQNVVWDACGPHWKNVILGPALSSLSTWTILIARRLLKRRTYLWGQCGRPGDRSIRRFLQEIMNRLATGLLVYGDAEAQSAQELGTGAEKVHVVRNATKPHDGFLEPHYGELIEKNLQSHLNHAQSTGTIRLLYVGRLIALKRVGVLLQASRILRTKYSNVRVDVVGGGPELEDLKKRYPEDGIQFHGWIYDDVALGELYHLATFTVSPYHMGLFAVDSLRYGVPALIPDNPMNASEVEALSEGINAFRFKAGDPQDLAISVTRALNNLRVVNTASYLAERHKNLNLWNPQDVAMNIVTSIGY